jgi:hypothetical protein|nr:hypothetical protein [uncultured Limnohabitans sp.]
MRDTKDKHEAIEFATEFSCVLPLSNCIVSVGKAANHADFFQKNSLK